MTTEGGGEERTAAERRGFAGSNEWRSSLEVKELEKKKVAFLIKLWLSSFTVIKDLSDEPFTQKNIGAEHQSTSTFRGIPPVLNNTLAVCHYLFLL